MANTRSTPDAGTLDVRSFNAEPGGAKPATDAIQAALDECADEGGTVLLPPGEFRPGPLVVGSHTTLRLAPGAVVEFVPDFDLYPGFESRWEGWHRTGFHPCLLVDETESVAIEGRGTVDGGGPGWWEHVDGPRAESPATLRERLAKFRASDGPDDDVSSFTRRPLLLQICRSTNVTVSGVTLQNSAFWNTYVLYSSDVSLTGLRVENPATPRTATRSV